MTTPLWSRNTGPMISREQSTCFTRSVESKEAPSATTHMLFVNCPGAGLRSLALIAQSSVMWTLAGTCVSGLGTQRAKGKSDGRWGERAHGVN